MLKKSLWGVALCTVASLALLLTPATSDAQRRGSWGGGRGGSWSGGRGNWNGGWGRGDWDRGWGWGGFGTGLAVGYGLGNWGGYGGYGGYYSGYSTPYYYSSDYSYPGYTYSDQSMYAQPQMGYYGAGNTQQQPNPNAVDMTVFVSDPNAQIWFENHQTQQRGTVRHFESNVTPGQTYTFNIRARFMQNGQPVDQTRTIQGQAGQHVNVTFGNPNQAQGAEGLQQMPNNGGQFYGNQQYYGDNQGFENRQLENRQLDNRQLENRQFDNRQLGNQPGAIDNRQGNQGQNQGNLNNQGRTNTPGATTNPNPAPGANVNPGATNNRGTVNNNTQGSGANNNQAPNTNQGTNAPPR